MKKVIALLAIQILIRSSAFADAESCARILQPRSRSTVLSTDDKSLSAVDFSPSAKVAVKSLMGKARYLQLHGLRYEEGRAHTSEVPTIASGDRWSEGVLEKQVLADGSVVFEINGVPAAFAPSKKINGTEFDGQSQNYFTGKPVRALGTYKDGVFVIESVVRLDVFSASTKPLVDAGAPAGLMKAFDQDPIGTAIKMVKGRISSPSPFWFRKSLFVKENATVRPGDAVLLITASGGQGDDRGAVNGHMAVGVAYVGKDAVLHGEFFNVYVTNEKEIVPGNIELNDYFGHVVSGQQNYRPTYTVALYGLSQEKILQVKAELDRFHPLFREGQTKITCNKNCATLSVQALAEIGIYGDHRNGEAGSAYPVLSSQEGFPADLTLQQQIAYIARTKRGEFMPGPALTSILQNLMHLNDAENLGLTRADFIFGGQTPSARRVGGAPTSGVANQILRQGQVGIGVMVEGPGK
jgi:uncharacterized Zn-binding protein involved in type VI secretion